MIIYSFDCGSVNMGVCIIEYNGLDILHMINEINMFYVNSIEEKKYNFIKLKEIIKNISNNLNNVIKILYIDLVRLIDKVDNNSKKVISNRLKYYLNKLEYNFPKPEKVLIESQFLASSLSCLISHQIQYHYSYHDNNIVLLNENFNLNEQNFNLNDKKIDVILVGPSLKNSIDFDKNNSYADTQLTSYNNYQVNKKHSIKQFLYLINLFDQEICIKNFNKKLADIADAYMMCINYIFKYL